MAYYRFVREQNSVLCAPAQLVLPGVCAAAMFQEMPFLTRQNQRANFARTQLLCRRREKSAHIYRSTHGTAAVHDDGAMFGGFHTDPYE